MYKLKCAIIGCGAIFSNHADAIVECSNANLYAVCDIDLGRATAAAVKYNCKYFTDYNEMLEDANIDVVHICTPHFLHATMTIDAMNKGKHVLTEKPMSISVTDASKMLQISLSTGKQL